MDAPGNISWAITATALVLLMTPGVAFFYGGLVKAKSVVSMMMMSFGSIGLVAVLWILFGFSMSAVDSPTAFAGNPFADIGLSSLASGEGSNVALLSVAYGATFAIITVALISGAIADRAKFGSWLIFAGVFATVGYFPVAAWVWGGGWIMNLGTTLFGEDSGIGVIDYAGGTVVHINAGVAALVLALLVGKRLGFGREPMKPHNLTLTMIGAGLLWFGWFGFNVGSIVNLDAYTTETGLVWLNTTLATCAAMMGWLLVEKMRDGKCTSLGAASGVVAGLVAITPACGNLVPWSAMVLGAVAGGLCALAVGLKYRFGYDDSLDVVGVHLVGGLVGTLGVGFLAADEGGLLTGGGMEPVVVQLAVAVFAMVWSAVATLAVAVPIKYSLGLRLQEEDEVEGIDFIEHGESAYDLGTGGGARRASVLATGTTATEVSA